MKKRRFNKLEIKEMEFIKLLTIPICSKIFYINITLHEIFFTVNEMQENFFQEGRWCEDLLHFKRCFDFDIISFLKL